MTRGCGMDRLDTIRVRVMRLGAVLVAAAVAAGIVADDEFGDPAGDAALDAELEEVFGEKTADDLAGVNRGRLEAQFAWTAHEAAVMYTLETALGSDGALFRYPNGSSWVNPAGEQPAWGVWNRDHFAPAMTQEAIIERYYAWADEAADRLGLPADHPTTRAIRLYAGCGVLTAHRERTSDMLATVGANWIPKAPEAVVAKHGLLDGDVLYNVGESGDLRKVGRGMSPAERLNVKKIKIGDEISTHTSAAAINADPTSLKTFHAYLRERMEAEGSDPVSFLGVTDLTELPCLAALPENAGRFERRLYYHSARFSHLVTADHYRAATETLQAQFPDALIYNNYSPHPLFLTGSDMNHVDWFVLCRNRAQSLGWGEDWAYEGGWSLGTAFQIVSFYSALVKCSVRSHEICQQGAGRLNIDWMSTYIGLAAAHVPVDVIIEEDLDAEHLKAYDVLLLGGFNLEARHVAVIHDWVERGGLLVGSGGAGRLDVSGDLLPATERLFGARQRPLNAAMKTARFQAAGLWPEPVEVAPKSVLHLLEPVGDGRGSMSITRPSRPPCSSTSRGSRFCSPRSVRCPRASVCFRWPPAATCGR